MNQQTIARAMVVSMIAIGLGAGTASAQAPFEIGGQLTSVESDQFDSTDIGFGGRAAWNLSRIFGVEGELNFYPSDIPDRTAVSGSRVEGLFGVTAGPRLNQWRPFARFRTGFLKVGASPEPIVCILIYPPTVSCTLAEGHTLFALDAGGGIELFTPDGTFVRFDIGDRLVRYPGPSIDRDGEVHDDDFIGHDLRFAVGAGWRF